MGWLLLSRFISEQGFRKIEPEKGKWPDAKKAPDVVVTQRNYLRKGLVSLTKIGYFV
ncbi:MAG: hypothetical protein GXO76_10885 [Calditrichaeota bacterium]|nr:hypothetical protein [Calditrichota bacterium]